MLCLKTIWWEIEINKRTYSEDDKEQSKIMGAIRNGYLLVNDWDEFIYQLLARYYVSHPR